MMTMQTSPRPTRARRAAPGLVALLLLAGCNPSRFKLAEEEAPAHREPATTTVYGDWVLATPTDSTGFAGARTVEMSLAPTSFVLTASYPGAAPTVVRGTVKEGVAGLLTLTPETGTRGTPHQQALVLVAGQPVTVLASAAGNTMVFSTPAGVSPHDPSSVWYRKDAARAAGTIPAKP